MTVSRGLLLVDGEGGGSSLAANLMAPSNSPMNELRNDSGIKVACAKAGDLGSEGWSVWR